MEDIRSRSHEPSAGAPSVMLREARARQRMKKAVWSAGTMVAATAPKARKGLNLNPKEAELEALAESKLERGDLAPLVCYTPLLHVQANSLMTKFCGWT
jgi:hypothetical protein